MAAQQSKTKQNVNFFLSDLKKKTEADEKQELEEIQETKQEENKEQKEETNRMPKEPQRRHGPKPLYGKKPKNISLRINQETFEKISEFCLEEEISVNSFINKAIKTELKRIELQEQE